MDQDLGLLHARINKLEQQVEFLLRINGLDLSSLRSASNGELLRYYQDAVQLLGLGANRVPVEAIENWAELFLQLSEYKIVRLQGIVDYNHTWEPFYYLSIKLMTRIRQHEDLGSDLGLQHLYAMLERGRRSLRDTAIIMCKRYPNDLTKRAKAMIKDDELDLDATTCRGAQGRPPPSSG